MKRSSKKWLKNEIEFLKENFATKGALFCAEQLNNRTLESIRIKAARLGLKRNKKDRYNIVDAPKGYKYCGCCQQILPESDFYRKNKSNSYDDKLHKLCRSCTRESARRSYRKTKSSQRERYQKNPEQKIYQNIKGRAKKNNIPFNLTIDDIQIPETCPVLGIPIIPFSASDNSPSVDKINPKLGYIKGNVCIISKRANRIKSDANAEEIQKVADWLKSIEQ